MKKEHLRLQKELKKARERKEGKEEGSDAADASSGGLSASNGTAASGDVVGDLQSALTQLSAQTTVLVDEFKAHRSSLAEV